MIDVIFAQGKFKLNSGKAILFTAHEKGNLASYAILTCVIKQFYYNCKTFQAK